MKFIFHRLLSRPSVFASIVFASLIVSLLALASPLFVIQVLNRYVSHGVDATLLTLSVGAIFAVIMEFGFRQVRLRFAESIAIRPDEEIALQSHQLITSIKQNALQQMPAGVQRQFLASADSLERLASAPNIAAIMDVPFAALFVGVLALLSPVLALVAIFFIAVSCMIAWLGSVRVQNATDSMFKEKAVGNHHATSMLNASDEVRAFRAQPFLMNRCQLHLRQAQDLTRRISMHRGTVQSLTQSATALMSVAVIATGAIMVVHGTLDVGVMIGANILSARALSSINKFASMGETFAKAKQSLELLRQGHSLPTEVSRGSALENYSGQIEFQDVAYAHPNSRNPLFESLSLKMPPGAILLLAGANGAGKTTFCRMVLRLVDPQRGSILIDGVNMQQIVPNWWRSQVCYVPQDSKFLNATILENLSTVNPDIESSELDRILDDTGLRPFIAESADGLNRRIENNGREFSAGIRRRLAFARALASACNLVVLDEPTEALDTEGCKTVYALFDQFVQQRKTIIVASSDPQIVNAAHAVMDLNSKPVPTLSSIKPSKSVQEKPKETGNRPAPASPAPDGTGAAGAAAARGSAHPAPAVNKTANKARNKTANKARS